MQHLVSPRRQSGGAGQKGIHRLISIVSARVHTLSHFDRDSNNGEYTAGGGDGLRD